MVVLVFYNMDSHKDLDDNSSLNFTGDIIEVIDGPSFLHQANSRSNVVYLFLSAPFASISNFLHQKTSVCFYN